MSEPAKNPFDLVLDQIRAVVREEIKATFDNGATAKRLLFTTRQAAIMLNVEESWLAARARAGKVPHRMLGHYRFFSLNDIETIIRDSAAPAKDNS